MFDSVNFYSFYDSQFNLGFIITKLGHDLFIVDQVKFACFYIILSVRTSTLSTTCVMGTKTTSCNVC